eukprot:4954007-Pleurochrysis_carterae.AAC.1
MFMRLCRSQQFDRRRPWQLQASWSISVISMQRVPRNSKGCNENGEDISVERFVDHDSIAEQKEKVHAA